MIEPGSKVRCLFPFHGFHDDELDVNEGDELEVVGVIQINIIFSILILIS